MSVQTARPGSVFIHPSSRDLVDASALIGERTRIWANVQIRANAVIGADCNLGKGVFVDEYVTIGDRCKIQNGVSVYRGVALEDGVFLGPHCATTNDLDPAAINPDGSVKGPDDWVLGRTLFRTGARVGANATVLCGRPLRIVGRWSMVAAGALVTHDVPDFALVAGHPARFVRYVCPVGLRHVTGGEESSSARCRECGRRLGEMVPQPKAS